MTPTIDIKNASTMAAGSPASAVLAGLAAERAAEQPAPLMDRLDASSFQEELSQLIASSASEDVVRSRLLHSAINHRNLVGGAFFRLENAEWKAGPSVLDHPVLRQKSLTTWLQSLIARTAEENRDVVARSPLVRNVVLVAVPFVRPDGRRGILALLATNKDDGSTLQMNGDLQAAHAVVRALTHWHAGETLASTNRDLRVTSALLELCGQLETEDTATAAAQTAADHLQSLLNCRSVVIGLRKPGRTTCSLEAVSGAARVDRQSELMRAATAALSEAGQRKTASTIVRENSERPAESLALQNFVNEKQCESATSVPLLSVDDQVVGAVLCVDVPQGQINSTSEEQRLLQTLCLPVGNTLDAVQRRQPGLLKRTLQRTLRGRKTLAWLLLGTLVLSALVMAIPLPYRIAAPFECEAVSRQYCVAPFDGILQNTLVKPGDIVSAGQVLAQMDARELDLELKELTARQQKADKEKEAFLADEKVAESFMAALEADRVGHRQDLLNDRKDRLLIRSDSDGIVLSGSHDQRENFPVKRGDPLLEVAPLSPLTMEIAVPDDEIRHVKVGMPVELRADSNPTHVLKGSVDRIRPRAETRDETNVFVIEVSIENEDGRLRPGMRGDARIITERHPLGWNLFHRAWEHASMKLLW